MKLLISTYSCAPHLGSEHGVGWNWTTEACRQGHEVWAMASPVHRADIEAACREDPVLRRIHWTFPEVGIWPITPGQEPKWERSYNLLWQMSALREARRLQAAARFDAVHHLTWGGVRAPTFLASLGAPLIVGPIGGGEQSPRRLRDALPLRGKLSELLRDISNATITLNPLVRGGLSRAATIFVRTPETRRILNRAMQAKSIEFIELTLNSRQIGQRRMQAPQEPKLLFVGRLLHWKGAHIAIAALAELVTRMPNARLTIVGKGPEQHRLQCEAARLGLATHIDFIPWLPKERIGAVYDEHDLLLFPSLHDSGGTVVLEALSRGAPVVCLDLGGPGQLVTPDCGVVVATTGLNTPRLAAELADQIAKLFLTQGRFQQLSAGAIYRAEEFLLPARVSALYRHVSLASGLGKSNRNELSQAPVSAQFMQDDRVMTHP